MSGKAVMDIFKRNFPELAEHTVKWVDHHHSNISVLVDDGRLFKFKVDGKRFTLEGKA